MNVQVITLAELRTGVADKTLASVIEDARALTRRSRRMGQYDITRSARDAGKTLHSARKQLRKDGSDYLPAAWAFIDAARRMFAEWHTELDGIEA